MKCPNCNYHLVFLPNRRKYKCSICSKLLFQKEAETKAFREWNAKQKELDLIFLKDELIELKRNKRSLKSLFKPSRTYLLGKQRGLRHKDLDAYNEEKRIYYNKKSDHLNLKRKERYKAKKQKILEYQQRWEQLNHNSYKLKRRLSELRRKQKQLALDFIENEGYTSYNLNIKKVLPTFLLPCLLYQTKHLNISFLVYNCGLGGVPALLYITNGLHGELNQGAVLTGDYCLISTLNLCPIRSLYDETCQAGNRAALNFKAGAYRLTEGRKC